MMEHWKVEQMATSMVEWRVAKMADDWVEKWANG